MRSTSHLQRFPLLFLGCFPRLKTCVLYLVVGLFARPGVGQCPQTDLEFDSQEQLDAFWLGYPNCTELDVSITIEPKNGASFESLHALSNLKHINGTLLISYGSAGNPNDLLGLENLESVVINN